MPTRANRQAGFTLLELLIVLVIVGLLIFFILPGLTSAPKRSRDTTRKQDLNAIQSALSTYYNDYNSYPGGDYSGLGKALVKTYIPSMPLDPTPGHNYTYVPSPTGCAPNSATPCVSYTLSAELENSNDPQIKPGTKNTYEVSSSTIPSTSE